MLLCVYVYAWPGMDNKYQVPELAKIYAIAAMHTAGAVDWAMNHSSIDEWCVLKLSLECGITLAQALDTLKKFNGRYDHALASHHRESNNWKNTLE